MKVEERTSKQFQELLDRHHELQGELAQVEARLDQKEYEYLTGTATEGNHLLGWHKHSLPSAKKPVDISAKDKKFSLSSVFSKASLQLLDIADRRLAVVRGINFQKK